MKKALYPLFLLLYAAVPAATNAQAVATLTRDSQQPATPDLKQTVQLKQLLNDLGRQFQVNILFEESTLPDIQVERSTLVPGQKLDRQLTNLLKTYGLMYKKL